MLIFFGLMAVLVYGYIDAYSERPVTTDVRASVANAWDLYYDSMPAFSPMDNGQLFVQVTWSQPSSDMRVSSIRVRGTIVSGDQNLVSFDEPCQRAGSDWLADARWSFNGNVSNDLVCFAKVDLVLESRAPDRLVRWDEAKELIADMRVTFTAEVKAANKPMRYVTWINEQATRIQEQSFKIRDFAMAPFQRQ